MKLGLVVCTIQDCHSTQVSTSRPPTIQPSPKPPPPTKSFDCCFLSKPQSPQSIIRIPSIRRKTTLASPAVGGAAGGARPVARRVAIAVAARVAAAALRAVAAAERLASSLARGDCRTGAGALCWLGLLCQFGCVWSLNVANRVRAGSGLPTSGFAATEAARPKAVRKKVAFILEEVGLCVLV